MAHWLLDLPSHFFVPDQNKRTHNPGTAPGSLLHALSHSPPNPDHLLLDFQNPQRFKGPLPFSPKFFLFSIFTKFPLSKFYHHPNETLTEKQLLKRKSIAYWENSHIHALSRGECRKSPKSVPIFTEIQTIGEYLTPQSYSKLIFLTIFTVFRTEITVFCFFPTRRKRRARTQNKTTTQMPCSSALV